MADRPIITRAVPLLDFEISRTDGRTVTAYAATFATPYEVHDQEGHYDEVLSRASFNKVLARSGAIGNVQVFYNHGLTLWGTPSDEYSKPVGVPIEIKPDGRGLLTVTRYDRSKLGDEMLEMWREGSIRGQSFRGPVYESRRVATFGPNGRPVIERMALGLREYGPTPHPANVHAGLVAIRSQLLAQVGELTPDERRELQALLAESPALSADPRDVPATDPAPEAPVDAAPDAGLSLELLELANANRRRRL